MASLTFAIGDIHGCLNPLRRLLRACEAHAGARPARYVFLGDYVDRGPDSRGVVQLLMRRQQAAPDDVVCLKGNHEQMAIDAQDDRRRHAAVAAEQRGDHPAQLLADAWSHRGERISPGCAHCRCATTTGCASSCMPASSLTVPLDQQSADDMLWMREPFLSDCDEVDCGRFIVHGHTPQMTGAPELCRRRVNIDTGAVIGGPLTAAVFDDSRPGAAGVSDRRKCAGGVNLSTARTPPSLTPRTTSA